MSFYDNLALTASRLVEKYGQKLMLIRGSDTIDPVTGSTTSGATQRYQVNAILNNYPDNLVDGTRIKASDRLVIIGANVEPLITDKIRLNSQDWSIEGIKTSKPANTPLVYFIQARR